MKRWGWTIPLLLAAGVHIPALWGDLVWDDRIVQDRQIVAFQSLHDVFFPPKGIYEWGNSYYRPVITLSYLMDRALYGPRDTAGPHATVIICHCIATVLVWLLARQVLRRSAWVDWAAVGAAAVFAVHPIHTETVCWITGRSDTLAGMFLLGSLVCALHYRDRRSMWAVILAPVLFALALGTKEIAITGVVLLPVLLWLVPRPEPETNAARRSYGEAAAVWLPLLGAFALATAGYLVLRSQATSGYGHWLKGNLGETSVRLAGAWAYYLWKVVVPPPQCALVTSVPGLGYGLLGALAGVALQLLALLWWSRRWSVVPLIGLLWFGLTLAPSLTAALQSTAEQRLAERALYVPSVGLVLVIGAVLGALLGRRTSRWPAAALCGFLVLIYGACTVARERVWHDPISLWTDTKAKATGTGVPAYSLGREYLNLFGQKGHPEALDKALAAFREALTLYELAGKREGCWLAHNAIGVVHLKRGQLDEAAAEFRASLKVNGRYATAYYNLGQVAHRRFARLAAAGRESPLNLLDETRSWYIKAISADPRYVLARYQLAGVEHELGRRLGAGGDRRRAGQMLEGARRGLEELLALDSRSALAKRAAKLLETVNADLARLSAGAPPAMPSP
ncbi:MAG: tetratricopeptide repeat protein [Phycisphaerae bacterium]|jgi:tetratricopeptide (TPR) repeat protein